MASKRRRKGKPRKPGPRYPSGRLRHEPAVSPAAIAAAQPHRQGLGDHALDQLAESELGRMVIRGQVTAIQNLAGQQYAAQWRGYVGTLDGPRWPWRGQGRGKNCPGCPPSTPPGKCACELARRSWVRSWNVLVALGGQAVVTSVVIHDQPCPASGLAKLCTSLDALAWELGLTTQRNSANYRYISLKATP
jgi:hypothetical protein